MNMKVLRYAVVGISLLACSAFSEGQELPPGEECSDAKVNAPVVRTADVILAENNLSISFQITPIAGRVNPEAVVVVLGEDNTLPVAYAAVIGKQNSGATRVASFKLKELGKIGDVYYLPKIHLSSSVPVTVSLFGYKCDPADAKYLSSVSAYNDGGILSRVVGGAEKMTGSFYGLVNTAKVSGFSGAVVPGSVNTVNGLVTLPLDLCSKNCKLLTNLADKDTVFIDASSAATGFPTSEKDFGSFYASISIDRGTLIVKNPKERRIYVFLQRKHVGVQNVVFQLLGDSRDVGGGVSVAQGVGYSTTVLGNQSLEDAVYQMTKALLGGVVAETSLSGLDFLRAKMFSFFSLRMNAVSVNDLADKAQYEISGVAASSNNVYARMADAWAASVKANSSPEFIRSFGLETLSAWDAPLAFGIYSRLGVFEVDADAEGALPSSFEKIEVTYTDNIELFRRNGAGRFVTIDDASACCGDDQSWTISSPLGLGMKTLSGLKGEKVWKDICKNGLWARPKDRMGAKSIEDDGAKYQIRVKHGLLGKGDLFVGEIMNKPFVDIPTGLLAGEGSSEWLNMMPYVTRFRIPSDVENVYPINRSGVDLDGLTSDLKCVSGCGSAAKVEKVDAGVVVRKGGFTTPLSVDYQYLFSVADDAVSKDKYVADLPIQLVPYHEYVISGYGSPSDQATKAMEGLAVLYYMHKLKGGAVPEMIRIRRFYGASMRSILIDEKGTTVDGLGTSYYELNKYLFAGKNIKEIAFFGHGGENGTSLGYLGRNGAILGFYYGYYPDYSVIPAFAGGFTADANVNLYQCLGSTFYNKKDRKFVKYSAGIESEPDIVKPIAARLASTWKVPVVGFDWFGVASDPVAITSPSNAYAWGLSSIVEGNFDSPKSLEMDLKFKPIWSGNREAARLSRYSPDGARSSAILPEILGLGARNVIPYSMSLECLGGGTCSP